MIAGPDGVGKSTLSQAIATQMRGDRSVALFHQRASALPARTNSPVVAPHRYGPYPAVLSVCKMAYLFVDVSLGWLFRVRPFVDRGGWVVIERGAWDVAVDPARYRIALPPQFLRALADFLPEPSLIVVLEVSIDEAMRRKAELSREEFMRQTAAWRAIRPTAKVVFLDGTRPTADLVCEVVRALD